MLIYLITLIPGRGAFASVSNGKIFGPSPWTESKKWAQSHLNTSRHRDEIIWQIRNEGAAIILALPRMSLVRLGREVSKESR